MLGSREKEGTYLTVAELFLLKSGFSLCRSTTWVSTHPADTAVSLTIERAYLAILNGHFGHICHHEWGYGKYAMWTPKGAFG